MRIDHNRLQKRHGLSVGRAFGEEHRAGGRATHQLTHRAHVLVEERTGHQIGVVRVERHLRRLLAQEFARRALGNIIESIDFAASHRRGGLGGRSIALHDARVLEGIEVRSQRTSGHTVVHIDHTHRHFRGQTFVHQGSEQPGAKQRHHDHTEKVDRTGADASQLAQKNFFHRLSS